MPSQYIILSRKPSANNGMAAIGSRTQIVRDLGQFNTAPEREGDDVLYGPGIRLELPPGQNEVSQMILSINEEEIAWLVIMRLAKAFDWKIVDMNSGRELNA